MKSRGFARAGAVALVLLLLTSCGPESPAEPTADENDAAQSGPAALLAGISQLPQRATELDPDGEAVEKLTRRAEQVNRRATNGMVTVKDLVAKIPDGVKGAGDRAIVEFLDNRHLSHIKSVKLSPELAGDPANLIFEHPKWNLARGAQDMRALEKLRANVHNFGANIQAGKFMFVAKTGQGCIAGALLEIPVTAFEEIRSVQNDVKTREQAVVSGAKKVAGTTAAGCALTGTAVVGASAIGISLGGPVLVPIAVVGGVAYVWVSSDRIWSDLDDGERAGVKNQLAKVNDRVRDFTGTAYSSAQDRGQAVLETIQGAMAESDWWV